MKPEEFKLLELAAKALGYEIDLFPSSRCDLVTEKSVGDIIKMDWNPLKDNGDAFILAVKLDLMCSHKRFIKQKIAIVDPFYATRLAIVIAASEIGEKNGD